MAFVYCDRAGHLIPKSERDRLLKNPEYGRVTDSEPWRGARLVTFWYGIAPAPFITELITGDHLNQRWHWTSEEAARAGHDRLLEQILGRTLTLGRTSLG
jgi:hypothetical protein